MMSKENAGFSDYIRKRYEWNRPLLKRLNYLLLTFMILLSLLACTEELSIAEFSDDFGSYEQELRIEAILDPIDFSRSIIRVDRTILVTDTSLFNGRDDNGDWVPYTDENGNGQWDEGEPLNDDIGSSSVSIGPDRGSASTDDGRGNGIPDPGEPHVDDYIEILPQLHDSTLTAVVLRDELTMELVAEFEWSSRAGSFDEKYGGEPGPPGSNDEGTYITYYYGGYVPSRNYAQTVITPGRSYLFELITEEGRIISASTVPVTAPGNFTLAGANWVQDTLVTGVGNSEFISWINTSSSVFCNMVLNELVTPDSTVNLFSALTISMEEDESGNPLFQAKLSFIPKGTYSFLVESLDPKYGNYIVSKLPLRDRELSNWRDQDGNVVLGIAGSKSPAEIFLKITD